VACGEEGVETRYVACVVHLEGAEMIVDGAYCDEAAMPDSEVPCYPEDCSPERIPTPPSTTGAVTTEPERDEEETAFWRTGTWGPVIPLSHLCGSTWNLFSNNNRRRQ